MVNKKSKKAQAESEIKEYDLIAGGHVQADPEWEATEEEVENARARATSPRAPLQHFRAPAVVKSDKNLAELFPEKFRYRGDPRVPAHALQSNPAIKSSTREYEEKITTGPVVGLTLEDLKAKRQQQAEETEEAATKSQEEEVKNIENPKTQDEIKAEQKEGKKTGKTK